MQVTEDPVTGSNHGCRFTFDETTKRVTISGEDRLDRPLVAGEVIRPI